MTEKKMFIPARLKSSVVNGYVAGASDIIDDRTGKGQDEINQTVDDLTDSLGDDETAGSVKGRIKSLEGLVNGVSVEAQINDKINALDSEKSQEAGVDGLALFIRLEDGKVVSIRGSIANNVYAGYQTVGRVDAIEDMIPDEAAKSNKLADKNFVNSTISTASATFRGTFNSIEELHTVEADRNDYGFVRSQDADGNTIYNRYKFNGTQWLYEYSLNNSSFTAAQWSTINSGLTSGHKTKLNDLPNNAELQEALNSKQQALTFDDVPTANSNNPVKSGGIYAAIASITGIEFVEVVALPTPDSNTMGKIFIVKNGTAYDWYITTFDGSVTPAVYEWKNVNTVSVDLSAYYTSSQVDALLRKATSYADVYIGVGESSASIAVNENHHDILTKNSPVAFSNAEGYLWVIISEDNTPGVTMGNVEVPMAQDGTTTIDGKVYKIWKSNNTYSGSFNIRLI